MTEATPAAGTSKTHDSSSSHLLQTSSGPDTSKKRVSNDGIGRNAISSQELLGLAERLQKEIELKSRVLHLLHLAPQYKGSVTGKAAIKYYECRRHKLRWYPDCFRGSQAVNWLVENTGVDSREAAIDLGAEMLGRGLIFHVSHRHGFQDKRNRLYRFPSNEETSDSGESDAASVASSAAVAAKRVIDNYESVWSRRTTGCRFTTPKKNKWSLGQELTLVQGRVLDLDISIEDQKEMQGILLDAISEQIRGMQSITKLLTQKLEKANERTFRLQEGVVALVVLQVLAFLWLSGSRIIATALLVLSANVAYMWHQSRLPSSGSQEESKGVAGLQEEADRPLDLRSHWEDSSLTAAQDVARGRQILAGQSASASSPPGYETSSESSSSEGALKQAAPSMTIRRITEESPMDGLDSRQASMSQQQPSTERSGHQSTADSGPPSTSEIQDWPDAPLLVRPKALPYQICSNLTCGAVQINTGRPVDFETDVFKGRAVIWVQGLKSAPQDLFTGQHRKTSITIQGQFKQPAGLDDIVTGQEFTRPAVNLPAKWLVESVLIKIARSISPSMSIGPLSKPYLLVPAIAAAQVVNVSLPGQEPDPSRMVSEDLALFDEELMTSKGSPLPWRKRQRLFWDPKMRKERQYTQDHIWTFVMYQSQVNMSTYGLDVALKYDLSRHLDGQPLQFMMKDRKRDTYLCNFEAWHEKLILAASNFVGKGV